MDGLHTRNQPQGERDVILTDGSSIAGTRVNDHRVPAQGVRLEHGDGAHFGHESFRFDQKYPQQTLFLNISRIERQL